MNINEMRAKKAELKAAAEKLINAAMSNGKDLAGAELTQYNTHVEDIKGIESMLARHAELASFRTDGTVTDKPVIHAEGAEISNIRASAEYNKGFFSYLRTGSREIMAALNITTPGQGGYGTPQTFETQIVERLQNANVMRQLAQVITTESDRNFTIENNLGAAGWSAEAGLATNDNGADDNSFTRVTLKSNKLTRIIKVSEELLLDAFFDLPSYLASKFALSFGIAEELAFVAGNGTGQPTGVLSGASAGITTASPTAIVADELINTFYALKRAYRTNASWLLNDSTALMIRKLKDTQNNYLWQRDLTGSTPDVLLGKPVNTSDAMPVATALNKAILFGDFSYYLVTDRSPRTFTRLNELYAANGQVGFRGVERTDGNLTLAEAITTVAMHA